MSRLFASPARTAKPATLPAPARAVPSTPRVSPVAAAVAFQPFDGVRAGAADRAQSGTLPPLTITAPDDPSEREADRVADAVTSGDAAASMPAVVAPSSQLLRSSSMTGNAHAAPPMVHEVLASAGEPLDAATREVMEARLGRDFHHVRVHADEIASQSARTINARAYTSGNHIVFGGGEFPPKGMSETRLLAHELTHTLQPRDATVRRQVAVQPPAFNSPGSSTGKAKPTINPGKGSTDELKKELKRLEREYAEAKRACFLPHCPAEVGQYSALIDQLKQAISQRSKPDTIEYVVKEGDTILTLAERFLGNRLRWPEIQEENRIVIGDNPAAVKPGVHLLVHAPVDVHTFQQTLANALEPHGGLMRIKGEMLQYIVNHKTTKTFRGEFETYLTGKVGGLTAVSGAKTLEGTYPEGGKEKAFSYGSIWTSPLQLGTWLLGNCYPKIKYKVSWTSGSNGAWSGVWVGVWTINDDLDLEPGLQKSDTYNNILSVFGPIWHRALGGRTTAPLQAEWADHGTLPVSSPEPPGLLAVPTFQGGK